MGAKTEHFENAVVWTEVFVKTVKRVAFTNENGLTWMGSNLRYINLSHQPTVCLMSTSVPVPLGVADGLISDSAIRASSSQDRYRRPNQARLHNTPQGKHIGAWQPKTNDNKQFLQVDLGSVATIKQV